MKNESSVTAFKALAIGLTQLGIKRFFGVNGGGIIHVAKELADVNLENPESNTEGFITTSEYVAGFAPIGHYMATGEVAAGIATTGAASKLISCGLSDSKFLNLPALYLLGLNNYKNANNAPLQDVTEHGMNIIAQVNQELNGSAIIYGPNSSLESCLLQIKQELEHHKPVVFAYYPDLLTKEQVQPHRLKMEPLKLHYPKANKAVLNEFVDFVLKNKSKRIIICVGFEAARFPNIAPLITEFSSNLQAPTVWSVNGANAIEGNNPYGYGYIMLGGNDQSMKIWDSLNESDVLICLGVDVGEYTLNAATVPCQTCWCFSSLSQAYGQINHSYQHRFTGNYHSVFGNIADSLRYINKKLTSISTKFLQHPPAPLNLNTHVVKPPEKKNTVDLAVFHERLNELWQPNSIAFEDVCVCYCDRQYVVGRPNPNINIYTAHQGSAMGGALGLGIGAKYAAPKRHCFIFSGDGCWRLYAGALADCAALGLVLFIINNEHYAIVHKGLNYIYPQTDEKQQHCHLPNIDFVSAAKAHGWEGARLEPDLHNLKDIMAHCYQGLERSFLIEVPADPDQTVGLNPRYRNLMLPT